MNDLFSRLNRKIDFAEGIVPEHVTSQAPVAVVNFSFADISKLSSAAFMQMNVMLNQNTNASHMWDLDWKIFYHQYRKLRSVIFGFLSLFGTFRLACFVVLGLLRVDAVIASQYRTEKWRYSSASCSVVGTTITCTGEGNITPEMVQQAGTYTKYEVARIEWGITRIEDRAFALCSKLTNITIAESVVYIGLESFGGIGATSITFPSSLTNLNVQAVNACPSLKEVNMAFQNGTYKSENGMIMLTKDGSKGLYIVGAGRCKGTTFEIPSVAKIWAHAMRWNQATVMKVPDTVNEIQSYSFYKCTAMHTLDIGKGLQTLHNGAMTACTALENVILHSDNPYFYQETQTNGQIFGKKVSGSSNPQSILWVSMNSKAITIPGTVTEIGNTALQSSPSLISISVESTSTTFSAQCGGLIVCSKDGSLGKCGAGGAVDIIISSTVTFLDHECLRGLIHLQTVTFHSGVIGCSWDCFRECPVLHTVDFASCTMRAGTGSTAARIISSRMFADCRSLTTILNWPINSFTVEEAAFENTGFVDLVLPQQVVGIGDRSFHSCKKLHTITIPKTVTTIGPRAFKSCQELKNIIFESGSVLSQIDSFAFTQCTKLETITLPDSVTVIDNDCFVGDTMLTSIKFTDNSGQYCSDNAAVYKNIGAAYHTFYLCPPGVSSITLHTDTTVIATHAFYSCNALLHVDLTGSIERIEANSVFECEILKSIRLTGNIHFIGLRAFASCPNLEYILYCSNNADSIEYGADPFPLSSNIYCFYDFPYQTFCGHKCQAILDHQCNIGTNSFTIALEAPLRAKRTEIIAHMYVYRILVFE